jgi:tyrosine-protein kinase Etk/Wzc
MNKSVQAEPWDRLPPEESGEEAAATLRDYVGIVLASWRLVVFIVVFAGFIGLYIAWTAPPVYETNALVQIEEKSDSLAPELEVLSELTEGASPAATEIEILISRSILKEAVRELKLDITASPRYLGGFGAALARAYGQKDEPARPPLIHLDEYFGIDLGLLQGGWVDKLLPDLTRYAWGGERITVSRLNVPRAYEGEDKGLVLVTGKKGAYELKGPLGRVLLEGSVGEAARATTAGGGRVGIYVSELQARPGTEFLLTKWPLQTAVHNLEEDFRVVERGDETGILELTLEGPSPVAVQRRLNAIANAYLRQNVAQQSKEARQTLKFVNSQLPLLRAKLNTAEAVLREYQAKRGTVDLSLEAEALLGRLTRVQAQISALDLKRTELLRKYTEDHPLLESLMTKRGRLEDQAARVEAQLKKMPDIQSDFLKLSRNAEVADKLYLLLLNRAQQLKVIEAGVTGYVRIIDHALPPLHPAGFKTYQILLIALVLGFVCAVWLLLLRRSLSRKLETPDPIEYKLGIPVYATIPHSRHEARLQRRKGKRPEASVLACRASRDNAIESLRSLRTSLQFALVETKNNVVTITGPTPGMGKSFVAVNLAFLLADTGKRVLLIDGDMRRGHLHNYVGHRRSPGLSDVIAGQRKFEEAAHMIGNRGLYFMATGTLPPNPSELLVHDHFAKLVENGSKDFDMVICDTPPILNFTDGIIIARQSGTTFLVVRGQISTLHDVELSAKRLQQNDIKLSGVIFNDLKVSTAKYGYGQYGYYAYQYKPSRAEA